MSHEKGIKAAAAAFWDHDACEDGKDAEAAIKAYLDASGMVMVPEIPTEEMRIAWNCSPGNGSSYFFDAYYADMISAANTPFQSQEDNIGKI